MEVALEPAPLGIARFDDARARFAEVVELRQDFRLQALVLEREPNCGADLALELGDRRGVGDEGDSSAAPHERRDRAPRGGHGLFHRTAASVDIATRGRQPVRDSKLGIADRSGEGGLERAGSGRLAELGDDPGHGTPLDSGCEDGPQKAEGEDDRRRAPDDEDGQQDWVARIRYRRAVEDDRMRDRRGRERESAGEDRPQRPAGRGARRGEPPDADRRERCRRGGSEPEVDVLDPVGDARERADEEDVVRAVVPAVWVEEGIAEQRTADRRESSFEVDGDDECARTSRAQRGRSGKRERGGRRSGKTKPAASVPRLRTSGGPPFQPAQNGANQTTPASRARSPTRPAGRAKDTTTPAATSARPATTAKSGSEVGAPGVGRELARTARDGNRAQAVGERDCPGGEPSEVRRADRDARHGPIVAPAHDGRIGAGHNPALGPATMYPALAARSVVSNFARKE